MKATLLITFLMLALTGCVTETDRPVRKVDPQEVVTKQVELAIGYLRRADYQRAKTSLTRALKIDEKSALAHTTFGVLFQAEGEPDLAEEHFRKAIRYQPDLSQARNNYGAFLFREGRYQDAIEQLAVAAGDRFYIARSAAFENLGRSYRAIGELEKAEQSFQRAIELNPRQPRALLELAEMRFKEQNYAEARSLWLRHNMVSSPSARSLWLCIKVSERFEDEDQLSSCALMLKNVFPATEQYRQYAEIFE